MATDGSYTCIQAANLLGSDSPAVPTPVHTECWDKCGGEANGYTRVVAARKFVTINAPRSGFLDIREWSGPSLPDGSKCYLCKQVI